jgi:hypothetical protein
MLARSRTPCWTRHSNIVGLAVTRVGGTDVRATARAETSAGQPVTLTATAQMPPDAGEIVSAEWDFDGSGNYPERSDIDKPDREARLTTTHTFAKTGTYFPVVRVTSRAPGGDGPYGLVQNLARVRVVVR